MAMKTIIDLIQTSDGVTDMVAFEHTMLMTSVGLGSVFVVGAGANVGRIYLIQRAGQRVIANPRTKVFAQLVSLEMSFYDKAKTGELVNRLASDTERLLARR